MSERDPLTQATEALARRNFESEWGDIANPWHEQSAEIKRGWLSEALKQARVVAEHFQPRQVTTVEELDALPLRSIVMNDGSNPHAWQKRTDVHVGDAWYLTSDTDYGMDSYAIFEDGESATVLYVPEPTT